MNKRCESVYKNGKRCDQDSGHTGLHTHYSELKGNSDANFTLYEWNNKGENAADGALEFMEIFPCDFSKGERERSRIMDIAIADARKNLDLGVVFEVRARQYPIEEQQDKNWGISWYCVLGLPKGFSDRETATEPLYMCDSTDKGQENVLGGYVLLARVEA